jgi:hypothetical protein
LRTWQQQRVRGSVPKRRRLAADALVHRVVDAPRGGR